VAASFETAGKVRASSEWGLVSDLHGRSPATPRVSNHEAARYSIMIRSQWNNP